MPTAPFQPNAEMAAVAWIKSIPGVDATKVATTLPADPDKWATTGFITVQVVGGSPAVGVPMRNPVLAISAWKTVINSDKTPWGETQMLAETVFNAFFDPALFPLRVENPQFLPISIRTAWPLTEPRKVPGNAAGYAHVQFDAQFSWTTAR